MKNCPNCGAENSANSASCYNCYSALDASSGKNKTTQVSKPVPKPAPRRVERPSYARVEPRRSSSGSGSGIMSFLLLFLVLGGVGFGGYWFLLRPTPDKEIREAVKKYIDAIQRKDIDGAVMCMSTETQTFFTRTGMITLAKKYQSQMEQQQVQQSTAPQISIISCTLSDSDHAKVAINGDLASAGGPFLPSVQDKGSIFSKNSIPVVRENGVWKIDGMTWIRDGLKEMPADGLKQMAGLFKMINQLKPMMGPDASVMDFTPFTDLLNEELKRRNIDPASIQPPKLPSFPLDRGR